MYKEGTVFNIQRFSTGDGPGIRTVVFLKGCPLRCAWCHNPESQDTGNEIFYKASQCVGCQACVKACPQGCHTFDTEHRYHREACLRCGKCTQVCHAGALELCGQEKSAREIIDVVQRDQAFYAQSGGGLTLSGGEPLMQFDFSLELLSLAKENGLHTAVETCGFTHRDLKKMNQVTDLWLYDVKLLSDDMHRQYTGVSNEKILENLHRLDNMGANIILRCPVIPDVNVTQKHFDDLAKLVNGMKNVREVHLQPYHPLGISKANQLSKEQKYQNAVFLQRSEVLPFAERLQEKIHVPVILV